MNHKQNNIKTNRENSKRSNSNPSTDISKTENGRYSSYTSRYLDMYLTKSIKQNNIISEGTKEHNDLIVNISKIKQNPNKDDNPWTYSNTSNHSFETEELLSLMNKTTQSKSKGKDKSKHNKDNNTLAYVNSNRYNNNNDCLETFEIEENDIFINNSSRTNVLVNANSMIGNQKRQKMHESKVVQIIITYEYDNNKWKLIKEVDNSNNTNSNWFNNKCYTYYWICQEDYLSNCRIIPNNSIQSLNDIENLNKKLEKSNEVLLIRTQSLESKLDQYSTLIKKQINEIAELSSIISALNEDKSKLNAETKYYQNANNELSTLSLRLQSEIDIMKNKNLILTNEVKKIPHLINEEMKAYKEIMKEKIGSKVQLLQQQNEQLKNKLNGKLQFAINPQCEMQFIHNQIKIKEVSSNHYLEKHKMKCKFANKIRLLETEISQYKEKINNLSSMTISNQSVNGHNENGNYNMKQLSISRWNFSIIAYDLFSFTHDFQNEIASLQNELLRKDEENKKMINAHKTLHETLIKIGFFEKEDGNNKEDIKRIKALLLY